MWELQYRTWFHSSSKPPNKLPNGSSYWRPVFWFIGSPKRYEGGGWPKWYKNAHKSVQKYKVLYLNEQGHSLGHSTLEGLPTRNNNPHSLRSLLLQSTPLRPPHQNPTFLSRCRLENEFCHEMPAFWHENCPAYCPVDRTGLDISPSVLLHQVGQSCYILMCEIIFVGVLLAIAYRVYIEYQSNPEGVRQQAHVLVEWAISKAYQIWGWL